MEADDAMNLRVRRELETFLVRAIDRRAFGLAVESGTPSERCRKTSVASQSEGRKQNIKVATYPPEVFV